MNDMEQKAQAAAKRRFRKISNKQVMSNILSTALAKRLTPWLLEQGWVKTNESNISFTPAAKKKLDRLARAGRWMENSKRHQGQQAGEYARKAVRAISSERITCEKIFEFADQFGRLRKEAIDSRTATKPFAAPLKLAIGNTGAFAQRLTCAREIRRVGHEIKNCLANKDHGPNYIARARRKEIELWVLYDKNSRPVALLSINTADNSLEELKGAENCRPWMHRVKVRLLLSELKVICEDCTDATEIGICGEVLDAEANGSRKIFKQDGVTFDVGPGFLAIVKGQHTVLLQATSSGSSVSVTVGTDDGDIVEVRRDLQKRLRKLCRCDAEIREVCIDAFPGIDVVASTWRRAAE